MVVGGCRVETQNIPSGTLKFGKFSRAPGQVPRCIRYIDYWRHDVSQDATAGRPRSVVLGLNVVKPSIVAGSEEASSCVF